MIFVESSKPNSPSLERGVNDLCADRHVGLSVGEGKDELDLRSDFFPGQSFELATAHANVANRMAQDNLDAENIGV